MHGIPFEIPLLLFATFAGAFVAGLSGFAFGLVAASLWLYILTPVQTATLIVAFGLFSTRRSASSARPMPRPTAAGGPAMRQSDFSTAHSAASRAWPVFSSPSGATFAAGRKMSSARCFSRSRLRSF